MQDNFQTIEQFRANWNSLIDSANGRTDIQHACHDGLCVWNWELRPHVWAKMSESNNGAGQAWYCFLAEPATTWDCCGNALQKWVWNPTGDTAVASAGPGSDTTIVQGGASDPVYTPAAATIVAEYCRLHPGANSCQASPNDNAQPSRPNEDIVTLYPDHDGRALYAYINLGPWPQRVLIDTGATSLTVTEPVAERLVTQHFARPGPDITTTLADGSRHEGQTIIIDSVTIGSHTLPNVLAGVTPDGADMLLGLPLLNQIGRFTIDSANRKLIFG